jgi:hypothetical protein
VSIDVNGQKKLTTPLALVQHFFLKKLQFLPEMLLLHNIIARLLAEGNQACGYLAAKATPR